MPTTKCAELFCSIAINVQGFGRRGADYYIDKVGDSALLSIGDIFSLFLDNEALGISSVS